MADIELLKEMLPYLIPLLVIQVGLMAYALVDLARRDSVKGGSKLGWLFVIVFLGLIGPIVYLTLGREQH